MEEQRELVLQFLKTLFPNAGEIDTFFIGVVGSEKMCHVSGGNPVVLNGFLDYHKRRCWLEMQNKAEAEKKAKLEQAEEKK